MTEKIAVCTVDDIEDGTAKGFTITDHSIFALKRDGQFYVYRNSCPHLGVELNWREDQFMDMDGTLIQCATHGALFAPETGECLAGPCYGQYLEAIVLTVEAGQLYVHI